MIRTSRLTEQPPPYPTASTEGLPTAVKDETREILETRGIGSKFQKMDGEDERMQCNSQQQKRQALYHKSREEVTC